jgi:aspartate-semialdehyde dehydrogenase
VTARDGPAVAVLGATGYIGQQFVRLLAEHPQFPLPVLVGGPRAKGRTLQEVWQLPEPPPANLAAADVGPRSPAQLAASGVRLAFSALPSGTAALTERELSRRGVAVFSNAADLRGTAGVPLLVPEVNGQLLRHLPRRNGGRGLIVNNPNCSATGLAIALRPLLGILRIREVHVATYQALSGAGYPGVPSLAITDNVLPYIPEEEEKLASETRYLLGQGRRTPPTPWKVPVWANCARVATRDGHLEAVTIRAEAGPSRSRILAAWREFHPLDGFELPTAPLRPIELREEVDRPQPLRDRWAGAPARARGMAVSVGRVRWEPPMLRFFVLSHNAIRGGAGGSVLNAEWAKALDRLPL